MGGVAGLERATPEKHARHWHAGSFICMFMRQVKMCSHGKERDDLLKALIRYGDAEQRNHLLCRMAEAEEWERRSRRAVWIAAVSSLVLLAALWVAAVQLAEVVVWVALVLADVATGFGVVSSLVFAVLCGCWWWSRGTLRRVQAECERFVLGLMASKTQSQAC